MKKLTFTIFALFLVISSIQTVAAQSGQATVYFYSLATIKTIGQVKKPVFLDDQEIAEIRPARYFIVRLGAGKHVFSLRHKKYGGVEMNFEDGKTYYLRMNWNPGAKLEPGGISLIGEESGAYDLKQLKPVDDKNVKNSSVVFLKPDEL